MEGDLLEVADIGGTAEDRESRCGAAVEAANGEGRGGILAAQTDALKQTGSVPV